MRAVKLTGKTAKGKNKINESGKPDHWIISETREYVSFSDRKGPWLHVYPDNNSGPDKSRWVHAYDDINFNVELIP